MGDVGFGDCLLTSKMAFFFIRVLSGIPIQGHILDLLKGYALTKLVPVNLCFSALSLLIQSSCLDGSCGYRFALRRTQLWEQVAYIFCMAWFLNLSAPQEPRKPHKFLQVLIAAAHGVFLTRQLLDVLS